MRNKPQMELTTKRAWSPVSSAFQPKFDVFLSFRGADTRKSFADHLYGALRQKGIKTFVDDSENERGKAISPQLISAIEQSKIAVVVFSENYASSTWCLDELSKILERKEGGDAVLPIFYYVDPSDTGKHMSRLTEALNLHEKRFEENIETVERWRAALEKAANLRWKSSNDRYEPQLIKEIVNEVLTKVRPEPQERLFGMYQRLEQLDLLLDAGSDDVHFIGIWGMAGLGKTTLAKTVYERILHKFEVSSFLDRVSEGSKAHGLSNLQRNLSKVLMNKNIEDWDIHGEATMRKVLCEKKVLLVLDDVDQISQLETLCGNQDWFRSGSRVIITTRNEQLLITHGVERRFEMHELNDDDALQLFSWKAFKKDFPDKEYMALSKVILNYANGHPLALKVLGSLLHKRDQDAWRSALCKLKDAFKGEIMDTLRISYDELEKQEKNIFLDIACFFKGKCKDQVVEILDNDGFCSRIAMDVLIEKSLLTISDNMVWMHDLLQEMGWEIVRQQAQEPGERSRLWLSRDVFHVLKNNLGTNAVEGIVLDLPEPKVVRCNSKAFSKMVNLRLLQICSVHLPHGLSYLSNSLRFLGWSGYPLKSLPTGFQPDKIVELSMCHSSIVQLWSGIKYLDKLKVLNLSYSQHLTRTPDFTGVQNLERLYLEGCESLVEIHPSIGFLKRLISLNLKGCKSLASLPSKIEMEYLQSFILSGCSRVQKLPEFVGHMEHLREISLDGTATENIPLSVERLTRLSSLDMRDCINLRFLPSTIGNLKFLKTLDLSGCSNLAKLPESLGDLESLENIDLSGTSIEEWPSSIVLLKNLKSLIFRGPKGPSRQSWHMALPFRLMPMKSRQPMSSFLPPLSEICFLTELNLSNCNLLEGEIPGDIGCLSSLASLNLSSNNFVSLPKSISELLKLEYLSLRHCCKLQELPLLSSSIALEVIADGCTSMKKLQWPSNLDRLKRSCFNFINCTGLVEKESLSMLERYLKRVPYAGDRYEIVMPGSEIPLWFSHQALGSSVSVQLPRNWRDNKWMGYALCTVFQVFGSGWELDCLLKVNGKEQYPAPILATNVQPMSDHLWLVYISRDLSLGKEWQHRRNQLIFSFISSGPSFVKKCGVRLIYEQDVEEFNKILTQPSSKISPSEAMDALHHDEKSESLEGAIVQQSFWKRPSRNGSFTEQSHFKRSKAT
ncbi:PREDICTED: TMV resistance protein N-like [Prunus mume]|uniref:ADP-ribosyl cyclase/cyclic ADP-ribose hydrolase n=2 Tax=Prunus mume TaxID=102107 RepID=A0ABM0PC07_PRUMU|nr:PREDICTED: TMV resistance protein N-like [Prunus mume]XP_008237407.1 PREDICTED: TMV resistance protein N-like [Prunus mume]